MFWVFLKIDSELRPQRFRLSRLECSPWSRISNMSQWCQAKYCRVFLPSHSEVPRGSNSQLLLLATCSSAHTVFISFLPSLTFGSKAHLPVFQGSIHPISFKSQARDLFLRWIQARQCGREWMGGGGRGLRKRKEERKTSRKASPGCSLCCCRVLAVDTEVPTQPAVTLQLGLELRAEHLMDQALGLCPILAARMPKFNAEIVLSCLLSTHFLINVVITCGHFSKLFRKVFYHPHDLLPGQNAILSLDRWAWREPFLCLSLKPNKFLKGYQQQRKPFIIFLIAWKYDQSYKTY